MYNEQLLVKKNLELFEDDILSLINTHGKIKRVSETKDGKIYHIEFSSEKQLNSFYEDIKKRALYLQSEHDLLVHTCNYFYETYLKDYILKDKSKSIDQLIEDFEKDVASWMNKKNGIKVEGLYHETIILSFKQALKKNIVNK